jgi:hypothetical protein
MGASKSVSATNPVVVPPITVPPITIPGPLPPLLPGWSVVGENLWSDPNGVLWTIINGLWVKKPTNNIDGPVQAPIYDEDGRGPYDPVTGEWTDPITGIVYAYL